MTKATFKIMAVSAAGIALSGCAAPNLDALFNLPSAQPTTTTAAPAVSQAATQAATQPVTQPRRTFAHQRIGGTVNTEDGTPGSAPSDNDETDSWN